MTTVSNGEPTWKDTKMKLLFVISAILALTLAEEEKREVREVNSFEDSVAQPTNTELSQEGISSKYLPPSQTWQTQHPIQPQHTWVQPTQAPVQNDQYWGYTTPAPYKNDIYWGDNGDYKYEYRAPNGIHVGESGWFSDPKKTDESLVKKGWYSYLGPDGRTYTVTYWADHTGYHAYGSHLPSANPPKNPYPTTTQPPVWTPKPTYPVYPPYPTNPNPTYPKPTYPKPTYPIYQDQQPNYNQPQQQTYYPNYNA